MYSDKRKSKLPGVIGALVILLFAAAVGFFGTTRGSRDLSDEAVTSVREAVQRAALQCYVVEGAYPINLEYLMENYGLAVNTRDFYIRYDAFASNLPPDVRVEVRPSE